MFVVLGLLLTVSAFGVYIALSWQGGIVVGDGTSFLADDGVKIYYTFYEPASKSPAVILLHMADRDRTDWNNFATTLLQHGYAVLTIDFRGDGQSRATVNDYNSLVLDVKAAKNFLRTQDKADPSRIAIVGASIGANVGLKYVATDTSIKTLVLLSPGLDYRGVIVAGTFEKYTKPVLMVASEDDIYSFTTAQQLNLLSGGNTVLKLYKGAGHGTNMFVEKDLENVLMDWLDKNL